LGCTIIALTFAISSLIRPRWIKMLLSSVSILVTIVATWLIHVNFTNSPLELTPLFRYDYTWVLGQVLLTASGVALSIGTLGNLIDLSVTDESS
jgi:hypothetical protein